MMNILCRLLIAVGIFGIVFPGICSEWLEIKAVYAIEAVNDSLSADGSEEYERQRKEAERYNEGICRQQKQRAFEYRGSELSDPAYEAALNSGREDNLMAWVRVPSADIFLPVAHGTDADMLQYEAGHMYGTSLPSGGQNTHAVIAAHTGLLAADLFTNLTKVEIGDLFYIHVLGEIHTYQVDRIDVVLPEEEAPYLQVADGRDLVTLYTCTPYGINDHRLLVRGTRCMELSGDENMGQISIKSEKKNAWLRILLYLLSTVLPLIFRVPAGKTGTNRIQRRDK